MDTLKHRMPRRTVLNLEKLKPDRRRMTSLDSKLAATANADLEACYAPRRAQSNATQPLEAESQDTAVKLHPS